MAKPTKSNGTAAAEPVEATALPGINASDFSEEENLGFPPYWNPSAGARFVAVPAMYDDSDPAFHRWVWQASHDIQCHKGSKGDEEGEDYSTPVLVKKGEFFSTSNYAQFAKLPQLIGLEVMIEVTGKVKLDAKKTLWEMVCRMSKTTKAILAERRQRAMAEIATRAPAKRITPSVEEVEALAD